MDRELRRRKLHTEAKNETDETNSHAVRDDALSFITRNKLVIALTVRLLACFLTSTFFVPDEFWQSTEVAHRNVFQYGYLTWEWKLQIRSYFYPLIFEIYFRILDFLSLDTSVLIRYGPHVIQSVISSFCDISVYKLALKWADCKKVACYAYLLHLMSWFVFYTSSRTLSNTAEMCFSTIGLAYFPLNNTNSKDGLKEEQSLTLAILFGGIACIIRPTCLLIWAPLIIYSLLLGHLSLYRITWVCMKLLPVMCLLLFGADMYFYGSLTIVHWNFLQWNLLENIGEFYGSHDFHWYFSQGLPVICSIQLVFIFMGFSKKLDILVVASVFYVLVHSFIPHKEFRFLLPIYPILMCVAGRGFKKMREIIPSTKVLWCIVLLVNAPMALYFCTVHQRGTIDVMDFIRNVHSTTAGVLFLMPCHSTPYYSYLHQNITMRFLTCEPNISTGYLCESDHFFDNPLKWLDKQFHNQFQYVIGFNTLPKVAEKFLIGRNYSLIETLFHTHFPDGNVGSHVNIYSRF